VICLPSIAWVGSIPPTPSSTEEKKKLVRKYIGGEQLGEKGGRKLEKG
jgi:hypothetical protein